LFQFSAKCVRRRRGRGGRGHVDAVWSSERGGEEAAKAIIPESPFGRETREDFGWRRKSNFSSIQLSLIVH